MLAIEKWNKLVYYYNRYVNSPEQVVQSVWERIFNEILGYSSLDDEIERHRKVYIGSIERVITDIIIKAGKIDLFIVELKQHNMSITSGMQKQLFSYLKQLHNDIGILICDKLYIVDYDYNKADDEQTKVEIQFKLDNPYGVRFVELFSKENFEKKAVKDFVHLTKSSQERAESVRREVNVELVHRLLREYFHTKDDLVNFDEIIKEFSINISRQNQCPKPVSETKIEATAIDPINIGEVNSICKSEAIALFRNSGFKLVGDITFASRNKTGKAFWANPPIECLSNNWWIILNEHAKRELYLFQIPANTICISRLKVRSDKPHQVDLQINCGDSTFEDSRSNIKFNKWLVKTISY